MSVLEQSFAYQGSELEIFELANNWKRYVAKEVHPYLGLYVLEVGAGLGSFTSHLCSGKEQLWLCLEPDIALAKNIERKLQRGTLPSCCEILVGNLADLPDCQTFDTIIYLDVLEHIDDDESEIQHASNHLAAKGHLIILSPAHNYLFTPFDESIGHFRRYDRKSLLNLVPSSFRLLSVKYLDSAGMLTLIANRVFLRSNMPTRNQIRIWDRAIVPFSKILDPLMGYRIGKSILMVLQKL